MRLAPADGAVAGYFGIYPALVTDIVDSDQLGRIEVQFPWLGRDGERDVRAWATLCSPYADDQQGLEILPSVGTEVVVAFEAGNLCRPYILGAAWNGHEKLPQSPERSNDIRVLRTRADSRLEFDDGTPPKVSITMRSGHQIVLDDGARTITVKHSSGCTVKLTDTSVKIDANLSVDVKAPMVNVDAAMSSFTGIVECKTLMADSFVISPGYTPGVGNLL